MKIAGYCIKLYVAQFKITGNVGLIPLVNIVSLFFSQNNFVFQFLFYLRLWCAVPPRPETKILKTMQKEDNRRTKKLLSQEQS